MGTPVQITVTVDSNGAVTGFSQIGNAATTMGQQVSVAGLKGADAVAALTKQWEQEQAAIAAVNARIKEQAAALGYAEAAAEKASRQFQGLASDQMKASVAGRLLETQLGLSNRALNQVAARSALLGPLMAQMLPLGIAAAFIPMIVRVGESIANAAQAAGGMTAEVKKMNAELLQTNQQTFLNPKTAADALAHLADVNAQSLVAEKESRKTWGEKMAAIQDSTTLLGKAVGLDGLMVVYELTHNTALQKGMELDKERNALVEKYAQLVKQAGVDQAVISATSSGLHGFAKLKFDEAAAIDALEKDKSLSAEQRANKEYAVQYEFSQKRIQLEQTETDKTIALRHQVEDETLRGTAKILADEQASIDGLTRAQQRSGGDYAQYQQQKVLIHLKALNQVAALNNAAEQHVKDLQEQAVASALTGDDAIIAAGQKLKEAEGKRLAEGLENDKQYNAAIVAINQETNNKIQAADQKTAEKKAQELAKTQEMQDRAAEDIKVAQENAALAGVPEWQRASAQIQIELNRRERAIEDQKLKELAAEHLTQDQIVAINEDADAKKYDAIVQTNIRIQQENKRLVESLGSDLQSVFDDITSGNIGKRILSNMEKLFFQILAQWILSLNLMKSAAGSIFGSIVFGPGSTGAGVFGGGGQGGGGGSLLGGILGGLFGGGSSSESKTVGFGGAMPGFSGLPLPGMVGGTTSGLSAAIAGTGATANSAFVPSASNALTSSTMSDALPGLVGGTTAQLGGGKTGGALGGLFSAQGLASLAPLATMLLGSAGGKVGMAGGILGSLLLSGHLAPVLSALYGSIGLGATGALAGGAVGGLLGFGIGSSQGGLLGALAGAGSGALTGFMVGGPVGAIVGGIIGLLGGIFGGIFGGAKRKKQANAFADNTVLPDVTQIITGFDGFQIDQNSAIQQLEQLRTDAQKQLSALKSQGKDVFNQKVAPAIDNAEKHIRDTQSERDRRSAQVFGPPQFDTGGMFNVMRGNSGLALLHDGEFVVNPTATKNNRGKLEKMNAGGSVGGDTHHHWNITTMDAKSFDAWARNGGAEAMSKSLDRYWTKEGH